MISRMSVFIMFSLNFRYVKDGTFKDKGWPERGYGMSKLGVTAMSLVQQKDIDKDPSRSDIVINCVSNLN